MRRGLSCAVTPLAVALGGGGRRGRHGLRIDGEVYGDVIAAAGGWSMLVVSEKARVHGKVKAGHVIINGEVRGPVHSDELL